MPQSSDAPQTLTRRLGLGSAILFGLGSILGTGVFVSLGLAVGVAGHWAIAALLIAAILATLNALSSAQLAANHPVSGGTYAYAYQYLGPRYGPHLGFVAGTAFLLAKSASAATAAIGFVAYLTQWLGAPSLPNNLLASLVILLMTTLISGGLKRASLVNTLLVGLTLLALVALPIAVFQTGTASEAIAPWQALTPKTLLQASALLFVAFTGYGRIATLGEEVTAPRKTIPRAIITTLIVSTGLYALVLIAALWTLGPDTFASATVNTAAPLQSVAARLQARWLVTLLPIAASAAMAGVLLNLILGLSRVAFAMGRKNDLPARLGKISQSGEPVLAIWAIGIFVALIAFFGGLSTVWSFSAFTVLIYYAITNLAALQLSPEERLYPKVISAAGLAICLSLAVWISPPVMATGVGTLTIALGLRLLVERTREQTIV